MARSIVDRVKESASYGKVTDEVVKHLCKIVGPDHVSGAMEDLLTNTLDHGLLAYEDRVKYTPDVVVSPKSTKEVSEVVRYAAKERIPITPRGGCTGISGSAVPLMGGIALDMKRMDKIVKIDKENLKAVVQPGVTNFRLAEVLNNQGYVHPHDPGSSPSSTVGGGVATSGVGYSSYMYGVLTRNVLELEVVLADGQVVRVGPGTGRGIKSSVGFDLKSLFVGSFGTLGVVTEIILRIYPAPEVYLTGYRGFDRLEDMVKVFKDVAQEDLPGIRLMIGDDEYALRLASKTEGFPLPDINAILFYCLAGYKEVVQFSLKKVEDICQRHGGKVLPDTLGTSEHLGKEFYTQRHDMFPRATAARRALWHCEDIAIPNDKLSENCLQARRILEKYNLDIWTAHEIWYIDPTYSGYALCYFIDEKYHEENWETFEKANLEIVEAAIKLGGSGSICHGHSCLRHGVSVLKAEMGPALDIMVKIKKALDPLNIMNPTAKCFHKLIGKE